MTFWTDKYVPGQAAPFTILFLSAKEEVAPIAQQEPLQGNKELLQHHIAKLTGFGFLQEE